MTHRVDRMQVTGTDVCTCPCTLRLLNRIFFFLLYSILCIISKCTYITIKRKKVFVLKDDVIKFI
jgi:hypothetical protein